MFSKFNKLIKLILVLIFPRISYINWKKRNSEMAQVGYLVNINSETNNFLYKYIDQLEYSSLLEVGSNVGNRIITLAQNNPDKKFIGIDINLFAINLGIEYLKNHRIKNIMLYSSNLVQIKTQEYLSDVVVTWATLIYISPREIKKATMNLTRLSKKYIVIVEKVFHENDSAYIKLRTQITGFPNWTYNYVRLFKMNGFSLVKKELVPQNIWAPGGGGAHILVFKKDSF